MIGNNKLELDFFLNHINNQHAADMLFDVA